MSAVPEEWRLVVAVDLDEVLGMFVEALAAWHNVHHGTRLSADDFHSYHFRDVWGGTEEETRAKMNAFFESTHFDGIMPIKESAAVLRGLKEAHCKFVVVTSRHHVLAERTRAWLDVHFHGIFDDVLLGNHYGAEGKKTPKSELCASIGAHVLIDDSLAYALEVAPVVPNVILFGQYAWNAGHARVAGELPVPGYATGPAPEAAGAAGSGGGADGGGVHAKPGAPPPGPVTLPPNVVRAINWRHVAAILGRLRPRAVQGSPEQLAWPPPTVSTRSGATAPVLSRRDTVAVSLAHHAAIQAQSASGRGGGSGRGGMAPVAYYADQVRRGFELCHAVTLTGVGEDTRLAAEAAALLERVGDAVITEVRTGADVARPAPGAVRPPRITITVARTPSLLLRRFGGERSLGLVAAARAAPTVPHPVAPEGVPAPATAASDLLSPLAVPMGPDTAAAPPAAELAAAREEAAAALSGEEGEWGSDGEGGGGGGGPL